MPTRADFTHLSPRFPHRSDKPRFSLQVKAFSGTASAPTIAADPKHDMDGRRTADDALSAARQPLGADMDEPA
ncbi:hypothetical protein BJY16_004779 [Actinoplanes octamycinicus]|uniref:Uncharacterized protein n=1 Tax=Actinoplanes octamycinicus TaxID=135948 RepID=A0A7W7GZQ4_9ACTN|nr:hypothetical protein [Actinoplanes octamycinicus]MBB4741320.1 hypothetical protein [Actinoplanes octamycinicus]GIE62880.1 hypothetical protein Aoc01nite_82820 [Actinoplanes octamycinicus]